MRQLCYGRLTTSYAHNHQTSRIPMPGDPPEFAPHPPSTPIGWRLDSSTPPLLVSLVSTNLRQFRANVRANSLPPPPTRPPPPPPPPLAGSSTPPPRLGPPFWSFAGFQRICGKFARVCGQLRCQPSSPSGGQAPGSAAPPPTLLVGSALFQRICGKFARICTQIRQPSSTHPHSLLHPHWLAARLQGRPPLRPPTLVVSRSFPRIFAANSREFARRFASPPHPPSTHPHPHSLLHPHWLAARLLHPATQGRPPLLPPFRFPAVNLRQIRWESGFVANSSPPPSTHPGGLAARLRAFLNLANLPQIRCSGFPARLIGWAGYPYFGPRHIAISGLISGRTPRNSLVRSLTSLSFGQKLMVFPYRASGIYKPHGDNGLPCHLLQIHPPARIRP